MDSLEVAENFPSINSLKVFDWKIGVVHDQSLIHQFNGLSEIAADNQFDVTALKRLFIDNGLEPGNLNLLKD